MREKCPAFPVFLFLFFSRTVLVGKSESLMKVRKVKNKNNSEGNRGLVLTQPEDVSVSLPSEQELNMKFDKESDNLFTWNI